MVEKYLILKSLNDAISKCKTSSSARKRGKEPIVTKKNIFYIDTVDESDYDKEFFLDDLYEYCDVNDWEELIEFAHTHYFDYGEIEELSFEQGWDENDLWSILGSKDYISEIEYSDGTKIKYSIQDNGVTILDSLTIDGVTYKYGGKNASDNFKYQDEGLSDEELKHRYEVYKGWISDDGFLANDELRKGKEVTAISNYDEFVKWINESRCDYDNIVLGRGQKRLFKDDSIEKHIVKTKGLLSTSAGLDDVAFDTFKGRGNSGWMIYEVVGKGSGTKGLYLSNAVKDFDLAEREKEVVLPSNQRRERLLIDEENHIIIEKPI